MAVSCYLMVCALCLTAHAGAFECGPDSSDACQDSTGLLQSKVGLEVKQDKCDKIEEASACGDAGCLWTGVACKDGNKVDVPMGLLEEAEPGKEDSCDKLAGASACSDAGCWWTGDACKDDNEEHLATTLKACGTIEEVSACNDAGCWWTGDACKGDDEEDVPVSLIEKGGPVGDAMPIFDHIDANNDENIDPQEFRQALDSAKLAVRLETSTATTTSTPSSPDAKSSFSRFDANNDKKIDRGEFDQAFASGKIGVPSGAPTPATTAAPTLKPPTTQPTKEEREPCDGVFVSDKGNRYTECGPWRLKKRMPAPWKGGGGGGNGGGLWPGHGLVQEAAVPGAEKQDVDFLGWIWVFGAWEDKLFKMVSVDRDGKKIEDRYLNSEDGNNMNATFMPDLLRAEELQPYWDIAVQEGEPRELRKDYHPPPGKYAVDVDVFCKKNTHHCDETLYGRGGEGYRGCQTFTRHGEPCQKWTDQSPITHNNTPELRPGKGLGDHNFCRNPDGMQHIWCYIAKENMNADRRRACKKYPRPHSGAHWEWCQPLTTFLPPGQTTTTTTTVCQPLGDFSFQLVKKNHGCNARDRHFMGKMSRQRCAEAVRANGYKYFNWVKWCATGNCAAVGTKSAQCREGFRYSTKFDFFAIRDHGTKQAYVKHQLVKTGHKCASGEAFLGWMSSVPACANAVKSNGGKFFSYGNGQAHTAGACYKEDTTSSSCPEGWVEDEKFDFYALDETAEVAAHSGAECFHSQCCHGEGSAPCEWCGGKDWYCCDMKKVHDKKYPNDDKCAHVEIINGSKHFRYKSYYQHTQQYRCAKLKLG